MPAPAAPANFRVANIGHEYNVGSGAMIRLAWDNVAGASFRAQISPGTTGAIPTTDFTFGEREKVMLPGQLDCVFNRMSTNGRYRFRVRAENSDGVSAWVEIEVPFPFFASLPSEHPAATGLAVVEIRSTSLVLQWNDNSDKEERYRIKAREAGGVTVSAVTEVLRNSGKISGLRPATTYFLQVFPLGSFSIPSTYDGPPSNEIVVTTSNPAIEIRTANATFYAWRTVNHAPLAVIFGNVPMAVFAVSGLPAGLVASNTGATQNTISGTATAAVGVYVVDIGAEDSASNLDEITIRIVVDEPSITLDAISPAFAVVGSPLTLQIRAVRRGPIAAPGVWTHAGLPSWASGDPVTGEITGTPDASGEHPITVTASNGTQLGEIDFILIVRPATITPASADVYAGRPFSIELTPTDTAAELTLLDAPFGVTISEKETVDGLQSIEGTLNLVGEQLLQISGRLGAETFAFTFSLNVLAQISGGDLVEGWVGDPLFEALTYLPAGPTVDNWALSNQPPGVTIAANYAPKDAQIGGAPTSAGIFEAVVTTFLREDFVAFVARKNIVFRISGGLFLSWFHDDPTRVDLQIFLRSKEVKTYADRDGQGWRLTRGDTKVPVFILFRDGPLEGANLGRRVIAADEFESVTITIRPPGDFDCDPFLEFTTDTTTTIAGNVVFTHELAVVSDAIEDAFETLNASAGGEPTSEGLLAVGQATWKRADGTELTSRGFKVLIEQDENR